MAAICSTMPELREGLGLRRGRRARERLRVGTSECAGQRLIGKENAMNAPDDCWFDHERLEVYREAVVFVAWLSALVETGARLGEVKDQLDRASTSIPLNIAEGNGKYAPKGSVPLL